jgi:hypothetical protein
MFGYFSLIGLLKLHTLTSDYYMALKTIECIDLDVIKQVDHEYGFVFDSTLNSVHSFRTMFVKYFTVLWQQTIMLVSVIQ